MATREELQREWGPLTDELFPEHIFQNMQCQWGCPIMSTDNGLYQALECDVIQDYGHNPTEENKQRLLNAIVPLMNYLWNLSKTIEKSDPSKMPPVRYDEEEEV